MGILPLSQSITTFEGIGVSPFIGENCLVREDFVQPNKTLSYSAGFFLALRGWFTLAAKLL
jgi:hypothetical protein